MKALHEDLRWRVIYHQHLYGSSIRETARYLFTSTAFVSKIFKLYRERGDVSRKRRCGRQRILSRKYPSLRACMIKTCKSKIRFCKLTSKHFLSNIPTDRENRILGAMIKSKPELYMDEYQDWFQTITGTQISIATMCRSILRLGFTYKKVSLILISMNFV